MAYLHGVEIIEGQQRTIIAAGDTAVIALVGTAPKGPMNEVKLITSLEQAKEQYGDDVAGFTIPSALETVFNRVGAKVLVVNVLDNNTAQALMEESGKMTLTEEGAPVTHLYETSLPEAVDYTVQLLAGIDLLLSSGDALGIMPNIIIVPGYSQLQPVMNKMISTAGKLNGFAAIDIVAGTVQEALAARATGTFNITAQEAVLCYPQTLRYNQHENANNVVGLSVFWALAKAMRDGASGYWLSPSNTELEEIVGLTTEISSSLTDTAADTNLLNAQGIVTVFRKSGMGTRIWGNWTAAFPSKPTKEYMIAPRAVRMAIREALVDAMINYMDGNATSVMVDMVTGDVNSFIRDLIGNGALVDGK
ncbi:MAG: phage tail sheath subtilisin-like domain-containing protein, partial [Rikenellaceae bacterium]|nr:phage tail sheath subtilisin-like domain-containing protein [Rikenellaceae bacterium]